VPGIPPSASPVPLTRPPLSASLPPSGSLCAVRCFKRQRRRQKASQGKKMSGEKTRRSGTLGPQLTGSKVQGSGLGRGLVQGWQRCQKYNGSSSGSRVRPGLQFGPALEVARRPAPRPEAIIPSDSQHDGLRSYTDGDISGTQHIYSEGVQTETIYNQHITHQCRPFSISSCVQ
jgi:hypothetical protein